MGTEIKSELRATEAAKLAGMTRTGVIDAANRGVLPCRRQVDSAGRPCRMFERHVIEEYRDRRVAAAQALLTRIAS